MPNPLPCLAKHTGFTAFFLMAFVLAGCVSRKPLPFAYSTSQPAPAGAPSLVLCPTLDLRTNKDDLDRVLDLPKCLDMVMLKELKNCGLVQKADMKTGLTNDAQCLLQCTLLDLVWEWPGHDRDMDKANNVGQWTGVVGVLAYGGSKKTEVIGRARMRFLVFTPDQTRVLLDQEYCGIATENKAILTCDSQASYREMAAQAFRKVLDQFEAGFAKATSVPP